MGKTILPPLGGDRESYDKSMDRAGRLVDRGSQALDDGSFTRGVALGLVGIAAGLSTIVTNPLQALADLLDD